MDLISQQYDVELKALNTNESFHVCSGALPNVTGEFSQTQVFNVSSNSLTGTLPVAFSSLGAVNKSLVSCQLLLASSTSLRNWSGRHAHQPFSFSHPKKLATLVYFLLAL